MKLVYEVNGTPIGAIEPGGEITSLDQLKQDSEFLAFAAGVPLSDVTLRFVEG